MLQSFLRFENDLHKNIVKVLNRRLNKVIREYLFINFTEKIEIDQKIQENIKKSEVIIINHAIEENKQDTFFFICFKNTIIIINQQMISNLQPFFSNNSNLPIYFLSNCKEIINKYISIQNNQYEMDNFFLEEISNFNKNLFKNSSDVKIYKIISSCISGYLIKESYIKLDKNRIKKFQTKTRIRNWNQDEYIKLRICGQGSLFIIELIYNIEKEELFAVKKPNYINDSEIEKLIDREYYNYSNLNYPLLPKLYGLIQEKSDKSLVIEFINGQTLKNINQIQLNENEKMTIIFELMLIINYFHKNNFVYRDLKPDNVMIDKNKTIYIIDFDRLKKMTEKTETEEQTLDFGTIFSAPELKYGKISYKNDIYSIGQMINYINKPIQNARLDQIYKLCINENFEKRPSIKELMYLFYRFFKSQIDTSIIQNDPEFKYIEGISNYNVPIMLQDDETTIRCYFFAADQNDAESQYVIGGFYLKENFEFNVDKSIHYLTLAAEQNYIYAQYDLGLIYLENKIIERDLTKAIKYLTLAAEQNYIDAQYDLGLIYFENKIIERDLTKSIKYFTLAANQNDLNSLFNLGCIYSYENYPSFNLNKSIKYLTLAANQGHKYAQYGLALLYYNDKYIKNDINKAIQYFTLASDQNILDATYFLGIIYYEGKYIKQDINKSIYYFTLASKQNDKDAQYYLGNIFLEGNYIQRNINQAINYFTLAADQNHLKAQLRLGYIYKDDKYIKRDINKSIYYFTLASKQNDKNAQFELSFIYYSGKYIKRDINKSIYYFTLASKQNDKDAQYFLGVIFLEGNYIQRNINQAINYFILAADQNYLKAQFELGYIYYNNKYIKQDINKSIYYFTLASKQNDKEAQFNLGFIYYNNIHDINKSIQYYTLAANQNHIKAQTNLGILYYEKLYLRQDMDKALYYLNLASNQNDPLAQYNLGYIYFSKIGPINTNLCFSIKGTLFKKAEVKYYFDNSGYNDKNCAEYMKKAIHYFILSSNQNNHNAQYQLGIIYYYGVYVTQDIKKAIYYFTLAANQNNVDAQYSLGIIYFDGTFIKKDIKRAICYFTLAANQNHARAQFQLGIYYYSTNKYLSKAMNLFVLSSKNGNINAHFTIGFLYHEGICCKRDMEKSIHYYKLASSFNNAFAKNNLGIIYKNGIGDEIQKNTGFAIEFFNEAVQRFKDELSMYNLANIYIYEYQSKNKIDDAIYLLIKSAKRDFYPSQILLCIALIIKFGFDIKNIRKELISKTKSTSDIESIICQLIEQQKLMDEMTFKKQYEIYKTIDFLYDINHDPIQSNMLNYDNSEQSINRKAKNISSEFYLGFGINI